MNNLTFDQLVPGMEIVDEDGYTGIITSCKSINEISVKLTCCNGGYVIYCLDPKSKRFEKIYKKIEK